MELRAWHSSTLVRLDSVITDVFDITAHKQINAVVWCATELAVRNTVQLMAPSMIIGYLKGEMDI